jgi:S-adenosylmethionine decarboxylase
MKPKIYNYQTWIAQTDPHKLFMTYEKLLKQSGFSILKSCEHTFKPHGWTCMWLLGESHLALHTFPESKTTYLELASCVKRPFDKFVRG